jgi:aspartate racemase
MGPEATVDLLQRIIAITPAHDDSDHLRILIDNNPKVPSRIAALLDGNGPSPLPVLIDMARGLERQGADFLVMPCNTAHHYHADVASAVGVPFLNLMELVADTLAALEHRPRRVGMLASSALGKIALYEPFLAARGMQLVYPEPAQQSDLMTLIKAVKAGRAGELVTDALNRAARQLGERDVDCLLLACTELSVISAQLEADRPVHDAADILARQTLAFARATASH